MCEVTKLSRVEFEKVLQTGDYEIHEFPTFYSAVIGVATIDDNLMVLRQRIINLIDMYYFEDGYFDVVESIIEDLIQVEDKYYYLIEK